MSQNKFKKRGGGGSRGGGRGSGNGGGGKFNATPKGDPCPLSNPKDMEWRHFLSVKDFKDISIQSKIKFAQKFLEGKLPNKITNEAGLFHSFPMNYPDLINDKVMKEKWPNLEEELAFNADQVLGIFAQAASFDKKKRFFPRLRDFPDNPTQMERLKAEKLSRLLCVKGTVIRVANVTQMNTWLTYQCLKCEMLCSVEQAPKGLYTRPRCCPQEGCRSQTFTEMRTHASTLTINSQMIRLQENSGNSGGRIPRTVNCHLIRDLCDSGDLHLFKFLAVGSHDLSQAEEKITVAKAELILKMMAIFTQNESF